MKTIGNLALANDKLKHNKIAEILLSKNEKYKEIDVNNTDLLKYIRALYTDKSSYISIMKKQDNKVERWSLLSDEDYKLQRFISENDMYCSVNSMRFAGVHKSNYVKTLNAMIIDLDYYNIQELSNLNAAQVYHLLLDELELEKHDIVPTFAISSGKGLYLIWLLESCYATKKSISFWRKLEQELVNFFQDFGADNKVKDEARVLRLISSKNSKTGQTVSFIIDADTNKETLFDNVKRYEMNDFATFFWGDKELNYEYKKKEVTKKVKKKKTTQKLLQIKNIYSLNFARTTDIEALVNLRKNSCQEGIRETLLYIYRLHLLYNSIDEDKSLEMTQALNQKFSDPLSEEEVTAKTKNIIQIAQTYFRLKDNYTDNLGITLNQYLSYNGAYLFTNATIIKLLQITEEEQKCMTTLIGSKEMKARKKVRNRNFYESHQEQILEKVKTNYLNKLKEKGQLTRKEKNDLLETQIKELTKKRFKQHEIAAALDISLSTLKRHNKKIRENQKFSLIFLQKGSLLFQPLYSKVNRYIVAKNGIKRLCTSFS